MKCSTRCALYRNNVLVNTFDRDFSDFTTWVLKVVEGYCRPMQDTNADGIRINQILGHAVTANKHAVVRHNCVVCCRNNKKKQAWDENLAIEFKE